MTCFLKSTLVSLFNVIVETSQRVNVREHLHLRTPAWVLRMPLWGHAAESFSNECSGYVQAGVAIAVIAMPRADVTTTITTKR